MAICKNIRLVIISIALLLAPSSLMAVTWTAESLISSGDYRDIAIGDLNKDGRLDVAAAKNGSITVKQQGKTWNYPARDWRYSFGIGTYASAPVPDKDLDLVPDSDDDQKNTGTGVISWLRSGSIPPASPFTEKWEIRCTGVNLDGPGGTPGTADFSVAAKHHETDGSETTRFSDTFSTKLTRDVNYSFTAFRGYTTGTYSTNFKSGGFTYTYTGSYSDPGSGVSFIISTLSTSDSQYANFAPGDSFSFYTIASATTLTSSGGNVYNGVQLADVDKDGNLDILAVSDSGTGVWFGDGRGGWVRKLDNALTGGKWLKVGDFNRDGDVDIAIATTSGIKVYTGDGSGSTWVQFWDPGVNSIPITGLPAAGTYNSLAIGDYDNDGLKDIIAANDTDRKIYVVRNNGDGTWTSSSFGTLALGTYRTVVVADMDGDGKLDIAAGISAGVGEAAGISVYYGNGAGTWTASTSNPTGFDNYYGIAIADLNNDGNLDIAGAQNGGGIQVWFGDKATKTWVAQTSPTVVGGYKAIISADVAGNGIPSLMAAKSGGVDIISQVNSPYFNSWSTGPTAGGSYQRVETADIDKDGKLDIVATDNAMGAAVGGVHVFYGDGTRIFAQDVKYPGKDDPALSGTYYGLALGDMNSDGYVDIVATSNGIPGGISIWNYQPGTNDWTAGATTGLPISDNYYGVKVLDLNGDGYLDIVAGSDSGVKVYIWNSGTNQYDDKSPTDTGSYYDVGIADFNKDGKHDIAAAGSGGISIWLGKSDGSGDFSTIPAENKTALTEYTGIQSGGCIIGVSGGAPYAGIAAGDIDRDGNVDIVAGNNNNCGVQAWFNDGSGKIWRIGYATEPGPASSNGGGGIGFGYPSNSSTHSNIWPIGTGALTSTSEWTLTGKFDMESNPRFFFSVFEGSQEQASGAGVGFPYASAGPEIFDLVVVPRETSASTSRDDGVTFASDFSPRDLLDGSAPDEFYFRTTEPGVTFSGSYYGVALADINHDGYLDVVAASNGSGVSVWFGNGEGGWTAQTAPISYGDYNGVRLADLNGDGYLDIIASHQISGGIGLEVFFNDIDLNSPTVSSTNPAENSSNVATSDSVTVTFSEDIDRTTLNDSSITVAGSGSGSRTVSLFYDSVTTKLTINPTLDFFPKETVTVTLTTGITDNYGNRLDGNGNGYEDGSPTDDYVFTFQTKDTAPTNLTATAGDGQVALNWDKNPESDFKGYFVYRATASGGPYTKITVTPITTITYTDSTVTNDTTYYYVVTALDEVSGYPTDAYPGSGNGNYESGYSNEISATPATSRPTVTNIDPGNGAVDVAKNDTIEVTFSRAMNMKTLATSQFSVVGSTRGVYTIGVEGRAVATGTSTGLTATVLTDGTASFGTNALVGYYLNPNTSQSSLFKITANTATTITVEPADVMTAAGAIGNTYNIFDNKIVKLTHSTNFDSLETMTVTVKSDANGGLKDTSVSPVGLVSDYVVTFVSQYISVAKTIMISATPTTANGDGVSTLTVEAIVQDANGYPVQAGAIVTFTTGSGKFSNNTQTTTATTDVNGKATATITAPASLQTSVTVTASTVSDLYGTLSASTTVNFKPGPPSSITFSASPAAIPADGISTSTVTATIKDSGLNSVKDGLYVTFTTTLGTFPNGTTTSDPVATSGGAATATIKSGASGTPTITATVGGATNSGTPLLITAIPNTITVVASPSTIAADGATTSAITATVKDSGGTNIGNGVVINFTTTSGTLSASSAAIAGGAGQASVNLISTSSNGSATVTATWTNGTTTVSNTTTVTFSSGLPATVTVASDKTKVAADNTQLATISATVKDSSGNNVNNGVTVNFTITSGTGTLSAASATTTSGVASVTLTSGTKGSVTVTAAAATGTGSGTATVTFVEPPTQVVVYSSDLTIPADGTSQATITALVLDQYGYLVADGLNVAFSTTAGTLSAATGTTSGGMASVTITSTTTFTSSVTITATCESISSNTTIEFNPGPPDTIEISASPSTIYANGADTSTITATLSDIGGNLVKDGLYVTLTTTLGTFPNGTQVSNPIATLDGQVSAVLTAGATSGTATITARIGLVSASYAGLTLAIDNIAPTVTSVSPANANSGVAINTNITAVFSEAMKSSTLTSSTITATASISGSITGVISYNSSTKTVTFDPASDLPEGETITVTITTGVQDLAGNAMASNRVWSFSTTESTPPVVPSGLTATAGNTQATLSWTANTEPDMQGYYIYRSTTSGGGYTKVNSTILSTSTITYTDTGLTNGTTYYYVITAVDTIGNESAYSSEVSVVPSDIAPAAPTGLAASSGDQSVSLSWTANTESDLQGYYVYRSTTSGSGYAKVNSTILSASTTTYSDTGLTNGTNYYYVITAVDTSTLESGYSSQVSALPYSPGDADRDGVVNGDDLIIFGAAFGSQSGDANWNANVDFDNNGIIDAGDLVILGRYFGRGETW